MDPNNPGYPPANSNQNSSNQFLQPPVRRGLGRFVRNKIFIGAFVLILIILLALALGGKDKKDGGTSKSGKDASTYITRPGYEGENDGIGDATALISAPGDKIASFAGAQVMQACTLLTLDDIKSNGLLLEANSLTGPLERIFQDGQGSQAQPKLSDILAPSAEDTNSCRYGLKDQGVVQLAILQPFNVSNAALDDDIQDMYTAQQDMQGFKVYKKIKENQYDKNETTYLIRSPKAAAELRISLTDQAKKDALLNLVAERVQKAQNTPTPIAKISYKSPVMPNAVYTDCSILGDANFKQALGVEASPLTKERFASSIGVIEDPSTKKLYNYSSYDCRREIVDNQGRGYFTLQSTTYETVDAAKEMFAFEQTPDAMATNIQAVTPAIGDESFFGDPAALRNALVFRKGRLIVRVSFYKDGNNVPAAQQISTLRPILDAAVKDIKGF